MADMNFHSSIYDWLVIAGAQAKFKGLGTINNEGEYGFMLTGIDGDLNGGGGADKFRIKIWDKDGDTIVYDNQMGEGDDSNAGTEVGGGSIIIHKGKNAPTTDQLPEDTYSLPPFPNPANPEIWIPYQLASDSQVVIRIYGMGGRLIRTLDLGYQPAGFYNSRSKAAYWNGNNEAGERVTSGVYFYSIQAGRFAATRKILILK